MQRICNVCGCYIDPREAHFEAEQHPIFYCFRCGNRRREKASDRSITVVMCLLLLLLTLLATILAIF